MRGYQQQISDLLREGAELSAGEGRDPLLYILARTLMRAGYCLDNDRPDWSPRERDLKALNEALGAVVANPLKLEDIKRVWATPKRELYKELYRKLALAGFSDPPAGLLHTGKGIQVEGELVVCDGCRKPVEEDHGVILSGWLFAASVTEEGEPTGGIVGNSFHMGPYCYCRPCFERSMPWHERNQPKEPSERLSEAEETDRILASLFAEDSDAYP